MPTIKLPTRLAAILGVLDTALIYASTRMHGLSAEAHLGIVVVLGMFAALGIHPTDTPAPVAGEIPLPADGANQHPLPPSAPVL